MNNQQLRLTKLTVLMILGVCAVYALYQVYSEVLVYHVYNYTITLYADPAEAKPGDEVTVYGTVLREDGEPVVGVTVTLLVDDIEYTTSVTDSEGGYSFLWIPEVATDYNLKVRADIY